MASIIKVDEIQKSNGDPFDFGGKVLLHSTVVDTTSTQATSSSWTNVTGMSVTLTPQSANSKFRIDVRWFGEVASGWDVVFGISRDNVPLNIPIVSPNMAGLSMPTKTYHLADDNNSTPEISSYFTYDAPNTTSSITYTMTVKSNGNHTLYNNRTIGSNAEWNYERGSCEILVTEYA